MVGACFVCARVENYCLSLFTKAKISGHHERRLRAIALRDQRAVSVVNPFLFHLALTVVAGMMPTSWNYRTLRMTPEMKGRSGEQLISIRGL